MDDKPDDVAEEADLQCYSAHDLSVALYESWELAFRKQFKKLDNALVVARSIGGNAQNLRRRTGSIYRELERLRQVLDSGEDVQLCRKHLNKAFTELYALRKGLAGISDESLTIKKFLNREVHLEKHWGDSEPEDMG